nr:TetR/AcrR family transcriptional regulator C-terminal domain-containing protein [Amycolatopsis sp. WAC 01375]
MALVRAFREALLTHRDGARVYAGTHATGPNTLGLAGSLVGALREAGFDAVAALEKALLLMHFTTGHVLEEQAATGGEAYSHLSEVGEHFTTMNYADLFERGIRLMTTDLR